MAAKGEPRGVFRVGTSGWQFRDWRGRFYPPALPQGKWFGHYAATFDTVEVNNTFYHLPGADTFDAWRRRAPARFTYALKYSRYGTHIKRLKDPEKHLGVFVERAARLGAALGPVLVQLPPRWRADPGRLDAFLDAAPSGIRFAVEFRDPDWLRPEIYALLHGHGAALCIHDMIEGHPRELTARWTYLRFHGPAGDYAGRYAHQTLAAAARRIARHLEDGLDVYAYFNNDVEGAAVRDAQSLRRYVTGG